MDTVPGYDPSTPVHGLVYDMQKYFEKNVKTYLEVTGTPPQRLGAADTPFLDESRFPEGCQDPPTGTAEQGGLLNRTAAQVSMQTMYGARMARPELLRAVGRLATYLTKWGKLQDRMRFRMMSYINGSLDMRQVGFVGDSPDLLELWLFVDADFAGDRSDLKSTSGGFLVLAGPNTFSRLGISAKSRRASRIAPRRPKSLLWTQECVRRVSRPGSSGRCFSGESPRFVCSKTTRPRSR